MRAFSGTLVAFVVATGLSWLIRAWLVGLWASPLLEIAARTGANVRVPERAGISLIHLQVTIATALLLTVPVFSAEVWLLICRLTRRERARPLTIPFSIASTAAVLLALWLARHANFSLLVEFA